MISVKTVAQCWRLHRPTPGESHQAPRNPEPLVAALAWMVTLIELDTPPFGLPPAEHHKAFRDNPALYRLLAKGTHANPERRFHSAEDLSHQLAGVLRLIRGGAPGMPVPSHLFVSSAMTTTGRLGPRAEATLDERDPALDMLRHGDQALRSGNHTSATSFYKQAIGANRSVDGYLRLAEVLIERGEFAPAPADKSHHNAYQALMDFVIQRLV